MDEKAYGYLKSCEKILDVGCGRGRFIELCPEKMTGIDMNKESVGFCLKMGYRALKGKATAIPFDADYFDGIHCSHIVEHLFPHEAWTMFKEIDRVLKVGGVVVFRTPYMHDKFYGDMEHVKPYLPSAIKNYFVDNKLRALQLQFPRLNGHYEQIGFENRADNTAYMLVLRKLEKLG